jgi:hypothetical protein
METDKINGIRKRINDNKEKLKEEQGNIKNQRILRLKIKIDELQIQIERLK